MDRKDLTHFDIPSEIKDLRDKRFIDTFVVRNVLD